MSENKSKTSKIRSAPQETASEEYCDVSWNQSEVNDHDMNKFGSTSKLCHPHPHDVLFGRGNGVGKHFGNMYFHQLVKLGKPKYKDAKGRTNRRRVAIDIIEAIKNLDPPGRFLVPDSLRQNMWYEAAYDRALMKTCQALRENIMPARHVFLTDVTVYNKKLSVGYHTEDHFYSQSDNCDKVIAPVLESSSTIDGEKTLCKKLDRDDKLSISNASKLNHHENNSHQIEGKTNLNYIGAFSKSRLISNYFLSSSHDKADEVHLFDKTFDVDAVLGCRKSVEIRTKSDSLLYESSAGTEFCAPLQINEDKSSAATSNDPEKNAAEVGLNTLLQAARIKTKQLYGLFNDSDNKEKGSLNHNAFNTNVSCNEVNEKPLKEFIERILQGNTKPKNYEILPVSKKYNQMSTDDKPKDKLTDANGIGNCVDERGE